MLALIARQFLETMTNNVESSDFDDLGWGWTRANVIACTALAILVAALIFWQWYSRPHYIGPDIPVESALVNSAAARVDPNTASVAELTSLPNIGPSLAERIVDYRRQYLAAHSPEAVPFSSPADLQNVKGIGPKTAEKLTPYLTFESRTTRPPE